MGKHLHRVQGWAGSSLLGWLSSFLLTPVTCNSMSDWCVWCLEKYNELLEPWADTAAEWCLCLMGPGSFAWSIKMASLLQNQYRIVFTNGRWCVFSALLLSFSVLPVPLVNSDSFPILEIDFCRTVQPFLALYPL